MTRPRKQRPLTHAEEYRLWCEHRPEEPNHHELFWDTLAVIAVLGMGIFLFWFLAS